MLSKWSVQQQRKFNEIYMVHTAGPYNWSSRYFLRERITCTANKVELRSSSYIINNNPTIKLLFFLHWVNSLIKKAISPKVFRTQIFLYKLIVTWDWTHEHDHPHMYDLNHGKLKRNIPLYKGLYMHTKHLRLFSLIH